MDVKRFIDATMDAQVRDLQSLVRIPSVSGEPLPGKPYGQAVHDALTEALALANRLGFSDTRSLDGHCGVVDYGEGEEMLMVMAHLDVVPVGAGWTHAPFGAEIVNGRLYGRGVLDDKGAAVSALYALAAVKAAGIPLSRRVRIFFGCNEEQGWGCIKRYKETEPNPTLAFTPDADYPIVHSEMGICQATYHRPLSGSAVAIGCGTAANVIPGEASATLAFPPVPQGLPRTYRVENDGNSIRVSGRGGHAAEPDLAQNALLALLQVLAKQPLAGDDLAVAQGLSALLGYDKHGEGFGLNITDESGTLTLSPDMLKWDETGVTLTLDCRYPFSCSYEHLCEKLDAAFRALGFSCTHIRNTAGHFIAPDSELVSTLLDVYETNIGHAATPLSIGGGTYARAFPNAVGFGLVKEGEASECHMPDESMALADLRFNTVVIAEAIARLAGK